MNLNVRLMISSAFLNSCFRPRSGNYESEYLNDLDTIKGVVVSVPARGIMNLNLVERLCIDYSVTFPSPLGEL